MKLIFFTLGLHLINPIFLTLFTCLSVTAVSANSDFLAADQAFQLSAESMSNDEVKVEWTIAPHYYLYHQQFQVINNGKSLALTLPEGEWKDDPTFGRTKVHYNQVGFNFAVQPNSRYKILWQGCSQDGLCYPLQSQWIETDVEGLIPQQRSALQPKLGTLTQQTGLHDNTHANVLEPPLQNSAQVNSKPNSNASIVNDIETNLNPSTGLQWNDDQSFLNLLSHQGLFLNLLIFFGLGILLAFLPCSLPLIPILSSLIVQRQSGYKAVIIASSFVLSMAFIYGLMGMFVAEVGFSFQRWFQSPWVISGFALLFVIFALNLFGLFQFSLPQSWTNKLNQYSAQQKSGTIVGSALMGALSALIVGPCMSAPLAGALLFISQSRDMWWGGLYLFVMGLGIGLPLFIACVFGSKLLPKPGAWMNQIKTCFGFLMLALALYFIRPMIDGVWYDLSLCILLLIFAIYLIITLRQHHRLWTKITMVLISYGALYAAYNFGAQAQQEHQLELKSAELVSWHNVSTAAQFEAALQQAQSKNLPVVVDVYADWCVACQPIEKNILPRTDVQAALKDNYRIKLDLSQQHDSHQLLLKKYEILGPPTILFFDRHGQEVRALRITGSFKADQWLRALIQIKS